MYGKIASKIRKCEFKWHTPLYQSVWYQYVRSAIKVYYVLGLQLFTFQLNSVYSCLFCSLTLNMFSLSMHKLPACKFFSILLYYSSEWLICLQHLFIHTFLYDANACWIIRFLKNFENIMKKNVFTFHFSKPRSFVKHCHLDPLQRISARDLRSFKADTKIPWDFLSNFNKYGGKQPTYRLFGVSLHDNLHLQSVHTLIDISNLGLKF